MECKYFGSTLIYMVNVPLAQLYVLTTKFGNPRIGGEEEIEMEFEIEIVPETE
jgi:hypothetical protein